MSKIGVICLAAACLCLPAASWADPLYTVTAIPAFGGYIVGWSINNAGTVVGWGQDKSGVFEGFRWTSDSAISFLQVAGSNTDNLGSQNRHALLWTNGVAQVINPFAGDSISDPSRINNAGQVIGASLTVSGRQVTVHPFLYSGGVMSHLGTTCPGRALANAINDSGQIVGECVGEAVLFQNSQLVYLKDLVPSTPGLFLNAAESINSSGQIVANGFIGSDRYAFILTPVPEPGAFVQRPSQSVEARSVLNGDHQVLRSLDAS